MSSTEIWKIALLCAGSSAVTGLICYFAAPWGRAAGIMDSPDGGRKLHRNATPLMGGPAVMIPVLVLSFISYARLAVPPIMLFALIAASVAFVIGFIDDRVALSAISRVGLLTAAVAAVLIIDPLFVLHTFVFKAFGVPISLTAPDLLAGPFVVLMMLGFVNAANMADGMNGQLLGSVALWSAFIVYYMGPITGLPYVLLAVSCLVAFVFNLQGKLFTGSSGAYAMSLFVGFGAIAAYRLANGQMHAQIPVYWFWLPVLDCVRLLISRTLNGQSPFAADRSHFHHMQLDHMQSGRALMIYLALIAAPGIAAMISEEAASITLVLCIVLYVAFVATKGGRWNIGGLSPASRPKQT